MADTLLKDEVEEEEAPSAYDAIQAIKARALTPTADAAEPATPNISAPIPGTTPEPAVPKAEEDVYSAVRRIRGENEVRLRDKTIADNLANRSEMSRRFRSGIDDTQGMLEGAVGMVGDMTGIDAVRDWGYEGYKKNLKEAELNPGTVTNIEDIHSAKDAGTWVMGTLGNLAPAMAEMAVATMIGGAAGSSVPGAGSVVGAVAGAANRGLIKRYIGKKIAATLAEKAMVQLAKKEGLAVAERAAARMVAGRIGATIGLTAGSAALESGGMYTTQADKVGIENANPWSAAGIGLVSGATETITPGGRVIKRALGMATKPVERLTKSVARNILKKAGTKEFFKAVAKQIPKSMGIEGAQEFTQEILSTLNAFVNDPEVDMLSKENISGYLNSAAGGAVAGLFFGGFEGASKYSDAKRTAQDKVLENDPLENFQQNQKKIYDLEQQDTRTPEEETELSNLKQESDWIKSTPEFKTNRTQRVAELKEDLATLEKVRKPSEADQKTIKNYRQELGDLLDLSENNQSFEEDPQNDINNEEFLDKFIYQNYGTGRGATEEIWNEYGEVRAKKGEILKKNQEDDPYWKVEEEKIQAQRDVKRVKDKLAVLNKRKNPTNKEIQQIAELEQELGTRNKKLFAVEEKTNRIAAKAQENQRKIERDEHVMELEERADKIGLSGSEKVDYVADKLRGYDADVAKTVAAEEKLATQPQATGTNMRRPAAPANEPVNPIDRSATPEEKVKQLKVLSDENAPIVDDIMAQISADLGIDTGASYKKPEMIMSKAERPSILAEKPWHDVEHIRDSYRFKAITNSLEDYVHIAKILADKGVKIIKLDTKKMLEPKEWGWRFAAFDLQMPNGQMVEFYAPLKELEAAKKAGNHELFDKWRDTTVQERQERFAEYEKDLETSYNKYQEAWDAALGRLGLDSKAAVASWTKEAASLESVTRTKESLSSSGEKVPTNQEPSTLTKGSDKLAESSTITEDLSSVADTTAISSPPKSGTDKSPSKNNVTSDKTDVKLPKEKVYVPDIKVKVKYQHEKTGATVTTTVNAREAMAELDAQESILDKIINCMG